MVPRNCRVNATFLYAAGDNGGTVAESQHSHYPQPMLPEPYESPHFN